MKKAFLFCEQKRSKKKFDLLGALAPALPQPTVSKSFLLLFSKKKPFLALP